MPVENEIIPYEDPESRDNSSIVPDVQPIEQPPEDDDVVDGQWRRLPDQQAIGTINPRPALPDAEGDSAEEAEDPNLAPQIKALQEKVIKLEEEQERLRSEGKEKSVIIDKKVAKERGFWVKARQALAALTVLGGATFAYAQANQPKRVDTYARSEASIKVDPVNFNSEEVKSTLGIDATSEINKIDPQNFPSWYNYIEAINSNEGEAKMRIVRMEGDPIISQSVKVIETFERIQEYYYFETDGKKYYVVIDMPNNTPGQAERYLVEVD